MGGGSGVKTMNGDVINKFRVPLGSLLVDIVMVLSATWWAGGINARVISLDQRLANREQLQILPGTKAELAELRAKVERGFLDRQEILAALVEIRQHQEKLEGKIDALARQIK